MEDDAEDVFDDAVSESITSSPSQITPLSSIADAFETLAEYMKNKPSSEHLRLDVFCDACRLVSVLFNCLGIAFKFAEAEYINKVTSLAEASERFGTLQNILDLDIESDTVKEQGSLSRNLRRVRQGLDLIRALFEQFMSADVYTLREAASSAYTEVSAPYHSWAIRTAVYAGMYALPSKDQLLVKLNESDQSAAEKMTRYINASKPVIDYIDELYLSKNISLDW